MWTETLERDGYALIPDVVSEAQREELLASLAAVAESRNLRRLFTIDSDFYFYRLADGSVLEVVR